MAYNNYNGSGYDRTQYPSNDNPFDPPTAYDSHVPARYPPQTYENNDYAASRDSLASDYDVGGYSNAPAAARGYGTEKAYPEAAAKGGSHVKRWVAVAVGVLVLAGIATGIAVWRVNASKDGGSGSGSGSGTSSGTKLQAISGTAGAVMSNPSDPSDFEKDPRLHVSFYGVAYTPKNALAEYGCGTTLANVTEDIQLISQLTTRLRMYGSACNQSALVLQAIQDTKVNLSVWLGVYIGNDAAVNTDQMQTTIDVLNTYGTDHVAGVTVGNEYILNQASQTTAVQFLITQMSTFRALLAAQSPPIVLPVGTADAGSKITTPLAAGSDFIMANVHPFFGGLPIEQAAGWTWDYFTRTDVAVTELAPNRPPTYVAETGWPSDSMTEPERTYEAAVAGIPQLQMFLDTYPCTANTNGTLYFYFEVFDEPWKESFGGVEPYWGLFDANKKLKAVTMPTCPSP